MEDKFVTRFESGGLKYTYTITSRLCGDDTFFVVSYLRNEKHSEARSFEIEMRDEENEVPVWAVKNKNNYSEEIIPDELVNIIGQKINYYYDPHVVRILFKTINKKSFEFADLYMYK